MINVRYVDTDHRGIVQHEIYTFKKYISNFSIYRCSLFDSLRQNEICILPYSSSYLVKILLFGNDKFNIKTNKNILTSVIDFIIQSKRFDGPLFLNIISILSLTQFHFCMYPYCWVALLAISPRCLARALPVTCRIVCLVLCCFLVLVLAFFLFFFLFREFNVYFLDYIKKKKKKKKKTHLRWGLTLTS